VVSKGGKKVPKRGLRTETRKLEVSGNINLRVPGRQGGRSEKGNGGERKHRVKMVLLYASLFGYPNYETTKVN